MIPLLALTTAELDLLEEAHLRLLLDDEPQDPTSEPEEPLGHEEIEGPALAQARASLVARGLLGPDGSLPLTAGDDLATTVRTLLDLRFAGTGAVLLLGRLTGTPDGSPAPTQAARVLYLSEAGALVEDQHPEGYHLLGVALEPQETVEVVTDFLDPGDVPEHPPGRPGVPLGTDLDRLVDDLGHPVVLGEIALAAIGDEGVELHASYLLALGPGGAFCGPGPQEPEARATVMMHPVPPTWLGNWTRTLVDRVRAGGPVGAQ